MSSYNTRIKKEITKNTTKPLSLIDEKKNGNFIYNK